MKPITQIITLYNLLKELNIPFSRKDLNKLGRFISRKYKKEFSEKLATIYQEEHRFKGNVLAYPISYKEQMIDFILDFYAKKNNRISLDLIKKQAALNSSFPQ